MSESIREVLKQRKKLLGTWVQIPHPVVAGILSECGFDWICADMEHTEFDFPDLARMTEAAGAKGVFAVARVSENAKMPIRKALDMGVDCVIIPLVNDAEEAKKAVSYAKYPPEGIRGFSFCAANGYGGRFDEYVKKANKETAVVAMIESKKAVENVHEILEVEGIDGVFVGPYDMSGSYGIIGQTGHVIIQNAVRKVAKACYEHKKTAGIHIVNAEKDEIRFAVKEGFSFIALGVDTVFLRKGAKEILEAGRGEA